MIFTETKLKGAYIIDVKKLEDERGFFGRVWCQHEYKEHGLNANIAQSNVSYNKARGTLRGMHYQKAPFAEAKTIRCTTGAIYDVIVDIRPESPTFRQWIGVELTGDGFRMLYVPEGFAHGFITLKDDTSVHYVMTEFYEPGAVAGFRYNDPAFNIAWPTNPVVISEKDLEHPDFMEVSLTR
jgi:dTDP-4-dehydrorhamnose 3,5-epimerase